jgi:predicted nucleotidyltransferase
MESLKQPTAYPDVNLLLNELLKDVRSILKRRFIGMYLYGSLASGDFSPETSDIDFVIVTKDELSSEIVSKLKDMHANLKASSSKWAKKLEGSYIPQDALRRYDPANARHPSIGVDWDFGIGFHGSDWIIQRYILREQGVVVAGPIPATLIDPIQPQDIKRAVLEVLHDWWAPMLENNPDFLQNNEYQAYAILTMCRSLYTLNHGTIASKPISACWAQETVDSKWICLIEWALKWNHLMQSNKKNETIEFIQYTLEHSRNYVGNETLEN